MEKNYIEISFSTIVKTMLLLFGIFFVFISKELFVVLFISFIISSAFSPIVEKLYTKRVPKILSTIFLYVLTLGIFSILIYTIFQPLSLELVKISKNIPQIIDTITESEFFKQYGTEIKEILITFSQKLQSISVNAINLIIVILGGFLQAAAILALSFYLTIENKEIQNFISLFFPKKYQIFFHKIWIRTQRKLGIWLKAQLLLMFVIGGLSYIGLSLLSIPFALSLAILSGLFEIIPYAGPIFSAIVAIFIAVLYNGPFYGLMVALLYFLIQQVENYIILPKIMQKTVKLSPILVISALYLGGKLGGVIGGILAIPLSLMIVEAIREYREIRDKELEGTF